MPAETVSVPVLKEKLPNVRLPEESWVLPVTTRAAPVVIVPPFTRKLPPIVVITGVAVPAVAVKLPLTVVMLVIVLAPAPLKVKLT